MAFGSIIFSIFDWAAAADSRYREARKIMELDDHILRDVGLTRDELMAEIGAKRSRGNKKRPLGRRETNYWSSLANRRMARGEI